MFDEPFTDHPTPQFGPQLATILQKMSGLNRAPAAALGSSSSAAAPDFPVQVLHQALVEQSPQGMAMIQAFHLVYTNPMLSQITGYTAEELQALTVEMVKTTFPAADLPQAWQQLVQSLETGLLEPRLELCFRHKDGTTRWAETQATAVQFQGQPTILATCTDITRRKQDELELQKVYGELEVRVRERAEALATANQALQAQIIERKQAEIALQEAHHQLEMRVAERTQALAHLNAALEQENEEKSRLFDQVKRQGEQLQILAERRQRLAHKVIVAQEEERRRVSRELHDEAGQALTAMKVGLEMILADLNTADDSHTTYQMVQERLQQAIALSEETSARIRDLAHNLRPAALDDLGLNLALEGLCHDFSTWSNLGVVYDGIDVHLSSAAEICLFRFLQEALTNVVRHACAHQAWVKLSQKSTVVQLSILDDGQGFDVAQTLHHPHTPGMGLLGMQERIESLGGQLEIDSSPQEGAHLVVTIPLTASAPMPEVI
ncbi:MAG: PAS domain S-box protein [Anaerolineaceae bacterium]|nr:PAS domain S-box protein [Anaerolineaceae bacterium]